MGYFDAKDRLFTLVFAQEHDVYDVPGLVRLDYPRYLVWLLKQSGCGQVFFWEDWKDGGASRLAFYDWDSVERYEALRPQDKMWKKSGCSAAETVDSEDPRMIASVTDRTTMEKLFFAALTEPGVKSAFVIPIDVFCRFFQEDTLDRLLEKISAMSVAGARILVTAPNEVSASNRFLTDSSSAVSRLIAHAEAPLPQENLYARLKERLGEGCLFMNEISEKRLRNTVLHSRYKDIFNDTFSLEQAEQYAQFLACYARSQELRQEFPVDLQSRRIRYGDYSAVDLILSDRRACEAIDGFLARTTPENRDSVLEAYRRDVPLPPVFCSVSMIQDDYEAMSGKFLAQPDELSAGDHGMLQEIGTYVENLVLRGDSGLVGDTLGAWMKQTASFSRAEFISHGLWAIRHDLLHLYDEKEQQTEISKFCAKLFELLENAEHLSRERDELSASLQQNIEEQAAAEQQAKQAIADGDDETAKQWIKKCYDLKPMAESQKKLLGQNESRMQEMRHMMDMVRTSLTSGLHLKQSREILEQSELESLLSQL